MGYFPYLDQLKSSVHRSYLMTQKNGPPALASSPSLKPSSLPRKRESRLFAALSQFLRRFLLMWHLPRQIAKRPIIFVIRQTVHIGNAKLVRKHSLDAKRILPSFISNIGNKRLNGSPLPGRNRHHRLMIVRKPPFGLRAGRTTAVFRNVTLSASRFKFSQNRK